MEESLTGDDSTKPRSHQVRVHGLPCWLDARRLLGAGDWSFGPMLGGESRGVLTARATLSRDLAADLAARLRGVGLDGEPLRVEFEPGLSRTAVRAGRTRDARARRRTTPGFTKGRARADDDGRMYLTPEALALKLGKSAQGRRVIDAGCGVGGNAIGFARAGSEVLAIERDAERARLAAHNAGVYGVDGRVRVVHGDALEIVGREASKRSSESTLLFCDPPWGADWNRERCELGDFPMLEALLGYRPSFDELWAKLPPSFAGESWPGARLQAVFGLAEGDRHRVKFIIARG